MHACIDKNIAIGYFSYFAVTNVLSAKLHLIVKTSHFRIGIVVLRLELKKMTLLL